MFAILSHPASPRTARPGGPSSGVWQALATLAARAASVALVVALLGCASLPSGVQRTPSAAYDDVATTGLAQIAAASAGDAPPALSGFRLLPAGDQALDARLALARHAQKSLDVQYYLIAHDGAGLLFLRELRDAAARGVRVRILIDDLYASGQDALLAGLAAHANVEVRLFNPLPVRNGTLGERVTLSLHEFSRINGRMHNKLFVADNAFAISGGRNVADEYFDRSTPAHFIDMDIVASGAVVRELSAVFDRYWNSVQAYPVQSLVGAAFDRDAARATFDARVAQLPAASATTMRRDALGRRSLGAELADGRVALQFAAVSVHADAPNKVDDADAVDAGRAVMSNKLELMRSARSEVLLASPYFVPGARGMAAMQAARANNVRITVMTNSLATTDEPLVHVGYARYRPAMLKMGVALHELMPQSAGVAPSGAESRGDIPRGESTGSLGRLHAKLAVVDSRYLFIGSMNMDGRSARWNTEIGLVIDSEALAAEVTALLKGVRLPESYRLQLAADAAHIEWVGRADTVQRREPGAAWGANLRLRMASWFVAEDLL